MQVFTCCQFDFKMYIHAPFGDLTPKWGAISTPPDDEQATATGNTYRKCGKVGRVAFDISMRTDKQTNKHTDTLTAIFSSPTGGGVTRSTHHSLVVATIALNRALPAAADRTQNRKYITHSNSREGPSRGHCQHARKT